MRTLTAIKQTFTDINQIRSDSDFAIALTTLEADIRTITSAEFSATSRRNAKDAISRLVRTILDTIPLEKVPEVLFNGWSSKDTGNELAQIDQIISIETSIAPTLQKNEVLYDRIATDLNALMNEIATLISPDNKHTCIKRPTLVITSMLSHTLLSDLLDKRFRKSPSRPAHTITLAHLATLITPLSTVFLDRKTTPKLYSSDGLNLTTIKKITKQAVGQVTARPIGSRQ